MSFKKLVKKETLPRTDEYIESVIYPHDHSTDAEGKVAHSDTTGLTTDNHHPQIHAAEHEIGGGDLLTHDNITGITTDNHHPQIHDLSSHSDLDAGSEKITSVADPTLAQDVATKNSSETYTDANTFWNRSELFGSQTLTPKTTTDLLRLEPTISLAASGVKSAFYFAPRYSAPVGGYGGTWETLSGKNILSGVNYIAGDRLLGLSFSGAFGLFGTHGNNLLEGVGAEIIGTQALFSTITMKKSSGLNIIPAVAYSGSLTATDIYGMKITDVGLGGGASTNITNQYQTYIAKPTGATNNYQVVLEGDGTGTGIWFDGVDGQRIYSDGTNLVLNSTTGLVYTTANVSATGFVTRTSLLSADTIAEDWIKDTEDYKNIDGTVNHSAFKGYTEFEVTDFSRPEINIIKEEECNLKDKYSEEYMKSIYEINMDLTPYFDCEMIDTEKITYPHTKMEDGVDLQTEQNILRQGLYKALERIKYLEDNCQMKLIKK